MRIHSGKPVKEPIFIFHKYKITKDGKPGLKDSGECLISGWCLEIDKGDQIDLIVEPLMTITSITKRDHQGIFGDVWGVETVKEKEVNDKGKEVDVLKAFWAYKPNAKNKGSYYEAICSFTPQIKTK